MLLTETRQELQRLMADHREIHRELDECLRWCAEVRELGVPQFGEMGLRLARVRILLQTHFAREERTVGFADLGGTPLERGGRQLLNEHRELLADLDALIERFRGGAAEEMCWGDAGRELQNFVQRWQAHECAETKLMEEALAASRQRR